jgi:hypothetical protein
LTVRQAQLFVYDWLTSDQGGSASPALSWLEKNGQDRAVTDNVVPPSYDSAVSGSRHPGQIHPDAAARDTVPRLAPAIWLIVALLLSVGLWGAVWLAASALSAAWPW